MDTLSHSVLHRRGEQSDGVSRQEQVSIDFVVNGASLLKELVQSSGGHSDFVGRLVKGQPQSRIEAISKLSAQLPPDTETKRVILYSCPECGDIGCGAYTAIIERFEDAYVWRSFAYENGYEPAAVVAAVGPFRFDSRQYDSAVSNAANAL